MKQERIRQEREGEGPSVNQLQPLRKEAAVASSGVVEVVSMAPQPCGGTSLLFCSEGIPSTQLLLVVVWEEGRAQNSEGGWAP